MTDDNNKNGNSDFEDDIFDETSFDESYYEDDAVYDEADLSADDGEFDDDVDFDDTDWSEEEEQPLAGRRGKSPYASEKKPFFSFNTIVMIGAFVVGAGVLAFTVMGQSSNGSSSIVPKFISNLNISDVMDGGLFSLGDNKDQPLETAQPSERADQPAIEETGFLDDPEGLELQATGNTDLPPQPTPISPAETDTTLTPMPEMLPTDTAQADQNIPRTPDGMISATGDEFAQDDEIADVVAIPEAAQPSAEDILKRALANRGQKQQEEVVEQVAEKKQEPEVVKPAPSLVPAPVVQPVADIKSKTETVAVPSASQDSVKTLEAKLDTILKRMEKIETELSNVRDGRESEYESLQKTVTTLKGDISALKNAPAPKAPLATSPQTTTPAPKAEVRKAAEVAKKPAAPAKRAEPAYSPPKQTAQPAQTASWELRAAQPGKAWISKAGQRDMQGVVVGDTIPGIGRVTAISYQNGRWVVQGAQGQIRQ